MCKLDLVVILKVVVVFLVLVVHRDCNCSDDLPNLMRKRSSAATTAEVQAAAAEAMALQSPERFYSTDDYPDYQLGVKYDEYPMIVPKKRTAFLVNHLMVALKKAIDQEEKERLAKLNGFKEYPMSPEDVRLMDLQRRGHNSGSQRNRGRCYFNAVSCF